MPGHFRGTLSVHFTLLSRKQRLMQVKCVGMYHYIISSPMSVQLIPGLPGIPL